MVFGKLSSEELRQEVAKFKFWYHKIDLGEGVVTPGLNLDVIWNLIRQVRKHIDYSGKSVLDLASFDGLWAFEAEQLGAQLVIATDCYFRQYENFLFCREILNSKVVPYYNISPYYLVERLDVFLQEDFDNNLKPIDRLFDIVQHLGLLYHLRDPMFSLSQARSLLKKGGYLLVETSVVDDETSSFMLFNGAPPNRNRIYNDLTTSWVPTILCLKEMLKATLFEPLDETVYKLPEMSKTLDQSLPITRVALIAEAIVPDDYNDSYLKDLKRVYRNPGLVVEYLY
jgi:SAM-dependent methyltransferase